MSNCKFPFFLILGHHFLNIHNWTDISASPINPTNLICLLFISGWKDSQQKKKDEAKQKLAAKKVETVDEEDDDDVIEVDPNEADNAR